MNAGNLTARQLEFIWGELDEWCAPLRFTLEPSAANAFYVDLGGREGLRRRTPGPLEGRVLFLDTRPLHAVLVQHVVMLEQKIKGEPLSDRTPQRSEQLALLTKLAAQVDPEFKPFARRGERAATAGTVDAIVGFQKIASYLQGGSAPADSARRYDGQELRQHDGARGVRPHSRRTDAPQRARAAAPRRARGAGRPVGSEGRVADRLQAGRADAGRECGDARHAGRDPPARADRAGRSASCAA